LDFSTRNANVAAADPEFKRVLSDFLILPDGVGADVASKLLYGAPFPANLNGTDFIPGFLRSTAKPLKVGLLGARRENADRAAARLSVLAPQHRFDVIRDGFFSSKDEPAILGRLTELRPDILLVAMGVPRQELWIARNLDRDHCTLPIAVGALFDFLSGAIPRAPEAVRRLRLEWLFRLIIEPGRLWRRYIVGNPLFLSRVFRQKLFASRTGH
jgi:exopolysaccharide biosynthesis WecB/TagA/CpsF family protein